MYFPAIGPRRADGAPKTLQASRLGDQLPGSELRCIHRLGTLVRVDEGRRVIGLGDPGRQCLLVVDGQLRVDRDGRELARLEVGDVAGELALLTGQRCNANVGASADSGVYAFNRSEFRTVMDDCPRFARLILRAAAKRLPVAA